jgi:hypothetical protein
LCIAGRLEDLATSTTMTWKSTNHLLCVSLWECWNGVATHRKEVRRGMRLIWHTSIWAIWKARNNAIFNNVEIRIDDIVEEIKVLSWRWNLAS